MRAMTVAAIAAGCLIAMTSGCTAGSHGGTTTTRATRAAAHSAAPAGSSVAASPRASSISSSPSLGAIAEFAPCAAAQLTGRPGGTDRFMGTSLQYLVLTNTSNRPCTLSGPPAAASGFRVDGTSQGLRIDPSMDSPLAGPLVNLRPGQSAEADLISANPADCTAPANAYYSAVAIAVGRSGMVRVSFPAARPLWVATCAAPLSVGGFGTPQA